MYTSVTEQREEIVRREVCLPYRLLPQVRWCEILIVHFVHVVRVIPSKWWLLYTPVDVFCRAMHRVCCSLASMSCALAGIQLRRWRSSSKMFTDGENIDDEDKVTHSSSSSNKNMGEKKGDRKEDIEWNTIPKYINKIVCFVPDAKIWKIRSRPIVCNESNKKKWCSKRSTTGFGAKG